MFTKIRLKRAIASMMVAFSASLATINAQAGTPVKNIAVAAAKTSDLLKAEAAYKEAVKNIEDNWSEGQRNDLINKALAYGKLLRREIEIAVKIGNDSKTTSLIMLFNGVYQLLHVLDRSSKLDPELNYILRVLNRLKFEEKVAALQVKDGTYGGKTETFSWEADVKGGLTIIRRKGIPLNQNDFDRGTAGAPKPLRERLAKQLGFKP